MFSFFFFFRNWPVFRSVARKKKRPTIPCRWVSRETVCLVPRYDRADDYWCYTVDFRILLVTTRRIADDTRCWTGWLSAGCRNSSHPRRARSLARGTRIGLTRRASVLRPRIRRILIGTCPDLDVTNPDEEFLLRLRAPGKVRPRRSFATRAHDRESSFLMSPRVFPLTGSRPVVREPVWETQYFLSFFPFFFLVVDVEDFYKLSRDSSCNF